VRIIAACVIRAVAGTDHLTYLVEATQKAGDRVSLNIKLKPCGSGPRASLDPARAWNLNSLRGLLIVQQQEVSAMKLSIAPVVILLALSSPAFAQSGSLDNGLSLGKSMRGVNNGVPYPNTNVTDGTAPVGSSGWTRHHKHYRHHRHHKHH